MGEFIISSMVKNWFLRGWAIYKKNFKLLVAGAFILSGIVFLIDKVKPFLPGGVWLSYAVTFIISPVLTVGWYFLCLKLVKGRSAKVVDVFSGFVRFGQVWLTQFFWFLIMVAGMILLIVPGIVWGIKYGLSLFAVMDKSLSAKESIKFSGRITYGYKKKLFEVFMIVIGLSLPFFAIVVILQIAGSEFLILGQLIMFAADVLIIYPWATAAYAAAYDEISKAKESEIKHQGEENPK
jgi:hypothetical protein